MNTVRIPTITESTNKERNKEERSQDRSSFMPCLPQIRLFMELYWNFPCSKMSKMEVKKSSD